MDGKKHANSRQGENIAYKYLELQTVAGRAEVEIGPSLLPTSEMKHRKANDTSCSRPIMSGTHFEIMKPTVL